MKKIRELLEQARNELNPKAFIHNNRDIKAWNFIDQALAILDEKPCKICGGSRQVPERGYIAYCGYNDCPGEWHEKDMFQKKGFWHTYYGFLCPVCGEKYYREKLIKWPMIDCPACTETSQEPAELIKPLICPKCTKQFPRYMNTEFNGHVGNCKNPPPDEPESQEPGHLQEAKDKVDSWPDWKKKGSFPPWKANHITDASEKGPDGHIKCPDCGQWKLPEGGCCCPKGETSEFVEECYAEMRDVHTAHDAIQITRLRDIIIKVCRRLKDVDIKRGFQDAMIVGLQESLEAAEKRADEAEADNEAMGQRYEGLEQHHKKALETGKQLQAKFAEAEKERDKYWQESIEARADITDKCKVKELQALLRKHGICPQCGEEYSENIHTYKKG